MSSTSAAHLIDLRRKVDRLMKNGDLFGDRRYHFSYCSVTTAISTNSIHTAGRLFESIIGLLGKHW